MSGLPKDAFRLRAATADDLALTYAITEDAMRGYVEQTWGRWDPGEQIRKHRDNFNPDTHQIILVADDVAGFFATEDLPTHVWLVKLYLLAGHRGNGVGSRVLQQVLQRARQQGKPVHLRVLKVNTRAQRFYAKHGFAVAGEGAEHLFMHSVA